jgi:tRNA pseudouridine55 synthase
VTCCRYPGTNGFLNVNKSRGKTSFNIVAQVRKLTGEKHVGHAGTLDPLAMGVLPVCIGQAARLVEYMADSIKTYRAEIELGIATDTYDAEGKILQKVDANYVTRQMVEEVLGSFRGEITQETPAFSAVKYHGKPGYALARKGIKITPKTRLARVERIEIVGWRPSLVTLEIDCGKGTYIRSIASELGRKLGCGAYLKNLVRLRYGIFDIFDASTIEQVEEACQIGYWEQLLYPMDSVISSFSSAVIDEDKERALCNGNAISLQGCQTNTLCRVYNYCGNLVAVVRFNPERELWQPEKVFGKLDTVTIV